MFFNSSKNKKRSIIFKRWKYGFKKSPFFKLGGFDKESITSEDCILCIKIKTAGYKVLADPSVSVIHHGNPKTLKKYYFKRILVWNWNG